MFTGVGGFELGFSQAEEEQIRKREEEGIRVKENQLKNEGHKRMADSNSDPYKHSFRSANRQFDCIGFSEIGKYASQLLKSKFPKVPNFGDATKIDPNKLPDFDMLCGGFPCQAFSIAGKRRGFQDTRGTLFFEIARILEVKRPKLILLENVKGLLNHEKGQTFSTIIQTLEELGYDIQWMVLNSKFFGVPQNRERVFIIGSLRGYTRPEILPFGEFNEETNGLQRPITNTITRRYRQSETGGTYIIEDKQLPQGDRIYEPNGISPTIPTIIASRGRNPKNPSDRTTGSPTEQRLEPNSEGISNTLSSVQKDNMLFDGRIRRLTPLECERLQGFPDNWTQGFSDTQRYKMMGNAVTVNVIRAIAGKLLSN